MREGERMTIILTMVVLFALCRYLHWKMVATAYIAWMVQYNYQQPSEQELVSLVGWCAENYVKDLFSR